MPVVFIHGVPDTRARRVARLADCGHWWQCQKPGEVAALLVDHWAHGAN